MTEWVTPRRLTSGVHDGECTCLPLLLCDRCEREAMDLSPTEAATIGPDFQAWREGDLWVIDVPGYGITQAESEADIPRMAADLIEQTRAATVARFDAAPDAEESLRERVARAMWVTDGNGEWGDRLYPVAPYRRLADAAIAVIRGDDA